MIGGQPFWRDIDVPRVPAQLLQEKPDSPDWVSPATVIRLACALFDVDRHALLSHRREVRLVEARALVTWMLRAVPSLPLSYPKIGRALGGRDHTTIINLHRMAVRLRLENERFRRTCEAIRFQFGLPRESHHGN